MNDETISREDNPVRARVLLLYMDLSFLSARLKNLLYSSSAGSKTRTFKAYRLAFYELYNLSCRYDRLNQDIANEVKKGLEVPIKTVLDSKFIIHNIELVDMYISELKRIEILRL